MPSAHLCSQCMNVCARLHLFQPFTLISARTDASTLRRTQLSRPTESHLRYETASLEAEVTSSRKSAEWFAVADSTTLGDFNNESWLDWPPWNMSDSEWTEWEMEDGDVSLCWLGVIISLPVLLTVVYVTYLHVTRARKRRTWRHVGPYRCFPVLYDPEYRSCCKAWYPEVCSAFFSDTHSVSSDFVRLSEEGNLYPVDIDTPSHQLSHGYQFVKKPTFAKSSEYCVRYEQLHCDHDVALNTPDTPHVHNMGITADPCFATPDI